MPCPHMVFRMQKRENHESKWFELLSRIFSPEPIMETDIYTNIVFINCYLGGRLQIFELGVLSFCF